MVELPGGDHTITCTRLALLDGGYIFLRTKWFNTSFSITAMDFPGSWSCHVAMQEVEDVASMLGISYEEFFAQARLYLGDGISSTQYSFEALGQRPNTMRLSWTIAGMRYTKEPRVTLFLQEDNSTMELIPEFLNVLMDTSLIVKDLLARRKINKSKKVRQLAMQFSASKKVRKRSLSQQAPNRVGMRGGLDGLVVKSKFPNSTPKFKSLTVSYEHSSGLTTSMHPSSLTTLDGRVQQHELQTPAMENLISSRQVLQSVSSTSKSLNLGVHNAGRLISEEDTVPCYGHQPPPTFCLDRPNGLGSYVGVSRRQLKSPLSGYQGINENKREQAQADVQVQRLRAQEQRDEAVQVPMTDDHDYILDRVGSSQLQSPMKVDMYDGLGRVPPPKRSSEFTAKLYEDGLSSWVQPRTPIQTINSMNRPAPTFHDVIVPKNVHNTLVGDKAILSHESKNTGVANSDCSGWINPRKSSTSVESQNFELFGSKRCGASQGREGVIMLSDSEDEDHHNLGVDPGILDDEDFLDRRIPRAMEDLNDEPENRFKNGVVHLNDSMLDPQRGNIEVPNINESTLKDECCRSRLESEAQISFECRSKSQKQKDKDDVHEDRTNIFDEGKRMQSKERPSGTKAQLHLTPTNFVAQGANTYTNETTQSDKDPKNTSLQRISCTSRSVGRSKRSNSQGHPSTDVDQEQQKVVPDSDCYNFDDDRVKEKIKPNEVWALYDDIDTMPRYLIRVKEVSMTGAFWVKARWLQPHIASKKNERQKEETIYPRGCGDFEELKKTTVFNVLNCFSHRMEFTTKLDTVIQVYPQKGELWAFYSKKRLNQGCFEKARQGKGNEQNDNFRLMVILSNYEEGRPLDIWVLRKKIGYRTLWEPGYEKGSLPIGNMDRFSHRVPAHKLTAEDYPDLNKSDIWDIDAAAVPECQGKVTW